MSITIVIVLNALVAAAVVAALAYVSRIPYRLERSLRPKIARIETEQTDTGFERAAA